jgi:hypothetical protein
MNPFGQRAKIGDSLKFVVRNLYVEVGFQLGKKIQSLEAVDAQFLEEIVIRIESAGRNLEMVGGKLQKLFECLIWRGHGVSSSVGLRQIRLSLAAFYKFPQRVFHRGTIKEIRKQIDFAP